MDLSIVTTLYHSAPHLEEFFARSCAVAEKITGSFEIIFVNDGSPDNSLQIALSLYEKDHRLKIVELSRNFGHHKAMMAGLAHAKGALIFLMDCDLEEEPELLERLLTELKDSGADVAYGVQQKRKGQLFERASGAIFFKVFNLLSTHPLVPNLITARLMSKRYVSALLEHREREVLIAGLWALTGFKQVPVFVKKHHRSSSTYNLRQKISHLVNAITSFSSKPLVFIFYLGCVILAVACIAALDLIIRRIFFGAMLKGWASLIVSVWLLGGLTIFCLGVIGIYLAKIFVEVKQRPYTIVREIYEHNSLSAKGDSRSGAEQFEQARSVR
jgi:putative glycosyltransferase